MNGMTGNDKQRSRTYRDGERVRVTGSFEDYYGETVTELTGDIGKIDGPFDEDEGRWLVLFPRARGWFVPEDKLERVEATSLDRDSVR